MTTKHDSDSTTQTSVEKIVKTMLTKEGYNFFENPNEKLNYKLDLYGEFKGEIVIGEIYAGIDKLQSAQKKKVLTDCFKLVYVEKCLTKKDSSKKIKKIMVFIDDKIKSAFVSSNDKSNSWVKDAIYDFEIELVKINLEESKINQLRLTKLKQQRGNHNPK